MIAMELPDYAQFALAYAPKRWRGAYATLFALNRRLGTIIAQANEPILAQMRLAWWRDRLKEQVEQRPQGDAVLTALGTCWHGQEGPLIALTDGWEMLLSDGDLQDDAIKGFADGHVAAWTNLAGRIAETCSDTDLGYLQSQVSVHAQVYAFGDLHARLSEEAERDTVRVLAEPLATSLPRLPRALRPFAILSGLARYSLRHNGEPLMQTRGSIATAWRIGLAGR